MTGFLAADLAVNKITVNAVVPGLVGTEFRQTWAKELGERQGKAQKSLLVSSARVGSSELHHWCEDTNRREFSINSR
jgi:3-oxoacyl-[acyl-carrier protein] reductase